jgi:hypothetical protein
MCLFCFGLIEKPLTKNGLFHKFTNGAKLIEFRVIFVLEINYNLKFGFFNEFMDLCHIGPFVGTFTLQI